MTDAAPNLHAIRRIELADNLFEMIAIDEDGTEHWSHNEYNVYLKPDGTVEITIDWLS
jgi:hypothetical protein